MTKLPAYPTLAALMVPQRLVAVACRLVSVPLWVFAGVGQPAPLAAGVVVLRSGAVIEGEIAAQADRYQIIVPGGEIHVRRAEVDFVARDRDEAYAQLSARHTGRLEDHLRLADWCLREGLTGYAAKELAAAMRLQPQHPAVARLDRRLQEAITPLPPPTAPKAANPVAAVDLDRLATSLPPGAVETFTSTVQPLLLNHCGNAGCHGPGAKGGFALLRLPLAAATTRRATLRNLANTLELVDRKQPEQSRLLMAAEHPHGPLKTSVFNDPQSPQLRYLIHWVEIVAGVASEPTNRATQQAEHAQAAVTPWAPSASERPQTTMASREAEAHDESSDEAPEAIDDRQAAPPAGTIIRGAPPEPQPRDPFDPEIFNRRFRTR